MIHSHPVITRAQTASTDKIRTNQFFFKSKINRFGCESSQERSDKKDKENAYQQRIEELSFTMTKDNSFSRDGMYNPAYVVDRGMITINNQNQHMHIDFKNYQDAEQPPAAPFGSNSPRFMFKKVFYGEDLKLTPGPGYYAEKE